MYDLIGDIHGHATKLTDLLEKLGYTQSDSGYFHPERKVIFLGDFIDRGEELRQHKQLMNVVMPMVNNGHALAVMGNHEVNALAYHSLHEGSPIRPHSDKNRRQHQAFLNEYAGDPMALKEVLEFFYRLPLWLDLGELRVVHACWSEAHIQHVKRYSQHGYLSPELLPLAMLPSGALYEAIETLLKGVEVELSGGVRFFDKDGTERKEVRIQWWNNNATTLGEVALPMSLDIGAAGLAPIPDDAPKYRSNEPPCFIGHYWMKGEPEPQSANVVCLDYSVAKGGKLVAYRWSGEQVLDQAHYVFV